MKTQLQAHEIAAVQVASKMARPFVHKWQRQQAAAAIGDSATVAKLGMQMTKPAKHRTYAYVSCVARLTGQDEHPQSMPECIVILDNADRIVRS